MHESGLSAEYLRVPAFHPRDSAILLYKLVKDVGLNPNALYDLWDLAPQLVSPVSVRVAGCDHDDAAIDGVELVEAVFERLEDAANIS